VVVEVVVGVAGAADDVRSLRRWLIAEDEFRGRVRPVDEPVLPGVLGTTQLAGLLVDAGGGVALAAVLVAWLRSRRGDVDLTVQLRGGQTTVRVSARRVRGVAFDRLAAEIERLGRAVDALDRPDGAAQAELEAGSEPGRRPMRRR
jgi:Effector Associated Constant Component 1